MSPPRTRLSSKQAPDGASRRATCRLPPKREFPRENTRLARFSPIGGDCYDPRVPAYRALVPLDWHDHHADPGEVVNSLPASSVKWLLDAGMIERVDKKDEVTSANVPPR